MAINVNAVRDVSNGEILLSTTNGISLAATGNHLLYTVATGQSVVVTKAVVRVTDAAPIGTPVAAIGNNATAYDNLLPPRSLLGLTAVGDDYLIFTETSQEVVTDATPDIYFGVDTAITGTLVVSVDLFGYVVGGVTVIATNPWTAPPSLASLTQVGTFGGDCVAEEAINEWGGNVVSLFSNTNIVHPSRQALVQAAPSAPFTFTLGTDYFASGLDFITYSALVMRDSATQRATIAGFFDVGGTTKRIIVSEVASMTAAATTTHFTVDILLPIMGKLFWKLDYAVGNTVTWSVSHDGVHWYQLASYVNTYVASVDQIGLLINPPDVADLIGVRASAFHWLVE